ncbi:hypothetical protein [Streptomyces sp. NPDC005799]|uniref:hypothetical protein n=1 Tax=Streptomyces sp. NPDC005799 TaxID=3154678 RepID=UPI0033E628F7
MDTAERTYLVECYWPGVTASALADAGIRAAAAARELSTLGRNVRFLGSLLVPADETAFCRFAGGCAADVERVSTLARLPFARILESVELPGDNDFLP